MIKQYWYLYGCVSQYQITVNMYASQVNRCTASRTNSLASKINRF